MTRLGGSADVELTWFDARATWKKKYRGKVYYCPVKVKGKTDRDGYGKAVEWWTAKKAELDGEHQAAVLASGGGYGVFGDLTAEDARAIDLGHAKRDEWERSVGKDAAGDPAQSFQDWQAQNATLAYAAVAKKREAEIADPNMSVKKFVERYLNFKLSQTEAGKKSEGRWANLRSYLNSFGEFLGFDKSVSSINWGLALSDYYSHLMRLMTADELGDYGARDKLQMSRQFIRYLWETGVIDLPRNLDSKELTIDVAVKAIKLPPFSTFKSLVDLAPEVWSDYYPLKLYLLLMANCGMTQMDISDLLQTEVDWDAGTIKRKRSKKQVKTTDDVPTVQYQLWTETFRLLKKYRSTSPKYVLVNRDGGALRATVVSKKSGEAKSYNTDLIADEYNDWLKSREDETAPTLSFFRKASATRFGNHDDYKHYGEYFLAHSAKTTADKFYIVPPQDRFDAAIAWLGKEYGLEV